MEDLKRAIAWCRREYRKRYQGDAHPSFTACEVMREAEQRFGLKTYGVEGFTAPNSYVKGVIYLNTGDTYRQTILFESLSAHEGRWSLGSWGDVVERRGW